MDQLPQNLEDYDTFNNMIETITDPNKKYVPYGRSLLNIASLYNHLTIVKTLIEAGADVNITDDNGNTPLHEAARRDNVCIVKYLLDNGNATNINNHSPLHRAAIFSGMDSGKCLLEYGADPECQDSDGNTAADLADQFHPEIAEYIRSFQPMPTKGVQPT
jgi:ankyrin repeat protein